jgi:hypothetical protein
MYGLNGKTEEIVLKNKSDTFEQNKVRKIEPKKNIFYFSFLIFQKDNFKIEAPDIGQIQKIRIGHNSKKLGSGWYLEKVIFYFMF